MSNRRIFLFAVLFMAVLGLPSRGRSGFQVNVRGGFNDYGRFSLLLGIHGVEDSPRRLLAMQIFSEPSHTALAGMVDDRARVSVLEHVRKDHPRSLSIFSFQDGDFSLSFESPPKADARIRVEVLVERAGGFEAVLLSEVQVPDVRSFEFSTEWLGPGSFRHEGFCGGNPGPVQAGDSPRWSFTCPGSGARPGHD